MPPDAEPIRIGLDAFERALGTRPLVIRIGGSLPINPSGGVLSSNPIGASGLLRFAESALQVMGKAGAHQVDGAAVALGHAYGGGSQYFSMWVVAATR